MENLRDLNMATCRMQAITGSQGHHVAPTQTYAWRDRMAIIMLAEW